MTYDIRYMPEWDAADIRLSDRPSVGTRGLPTGRRHTIVVDFDSDGNPCNIEIDGGARDRYGLAGPDAQKRAAEIHTWVLEQLASRAR